MPRFTICVIVNQAEDRQQVDEWLLRWRGRLRSLSRNYGCGCCVDMYDVDGPEGARQELPESVLADSAWSRGR